VDLYTFWCINCPGNNPPKQQMQKHVQWLQSQGITYGTLWIDVEMCTNCWKDSASNAQFIKELIAGAQAAGAKVGSTCF
jgi:hypothetical protein